MIEKLRILISRLFAVALVVLILISSSALKEKMPLLSTFLNFAGIAMVAVACLGRLWCSLYIAGYKTDTVVDQGPYSMCRNPLYFFSLVGAVGIGLASETLLIPVIILFAFAAYYPLVIKSEEADLLKRHGRVFKTYFEKVPRFFPRLSQLTEPNEYVVKPKVYKNHMLDAIWFILIVGFVEVIKALHALQILPTLFKIY
jgi:protein-S-isoprenylcysteine O-methyltransferase Ste14